LNQLDPITAQKLHPHDTYRIIRALEVRRITGKSISEFHRRHGFSDHRYDALKIGLSMARNLLYERIEHRVEQMLASGFVEEVSQLLDMGYSEDLKSMQSIGYRQIVDYIRNRLSLEDAVRMMKRDTRRYAKRQFTWFRADPEMVWLGPEQIEMMIQRIERFLANGGK
jgi:tRNA dimethylallyltransferase